jgi:hypothetical protein
MRKWFLVLGVVVSLVALIGGLAVASAQGKGNDGSDVRCSCDEWLMGTVMGKTGTAGSGIIELLPRSESTTVDITVNEETVYKAWMAAWNEVGFDDIEYGDWIAVCTDDGVAKMMVLLEVPFHLNLNGNVTAVSGNTVTVTTGSGGNYTIDLTNAGVNVAGIQEGQPVNLTIGSAVPAFNRFFPGLHFGWFIGKGNAGIVPLIKGKAIEGKLEQFREKLEQKLEFKIQQRLQQNRHNRSAD